MVTYHIHISVRDLLTRNQRDFKKQIGLFSDENGKPVSVDQAKSFLLDELSQGHEVIPIGKCSNFNYQTGCKGHPSEREA